jgi:hypothetical protein
MSVHAWALSLKHTKWAISQCPRGAHRAFRSSLLITRKLHIRYAFFTKRKDRHKQHFFDKVVSLLYTVSEVLFESSIFPIHDQDDDIHWIATMKDCLFPGVATENPSLSQSNANESTCRQPTINQINPCLPVHELVPCLPTCSVLSTGWLWASICHGYSPKRLFLIDNDWHKSMSYGAIFWLFPMLLLALCTPRRLYATSGMYLGKQKRWIDPYFG